MDPGEAEEPDREELASRVDQLEQTVSKMLPDRRGVLKGLGAAAVGGAAVGASSGGASGQSAAGQVGTESEPVDVEAANVAAQAVDATEATIDDLTLRTTSNVLFETDPNDNLGTHSVSIFAGGSTTLSGLLWYGDRGLQFGKLNSEYSGLPGLDWIDVPGDNNTGVAVRPPDTGYAGVWWDRSDGSKEWAYRAVSGQDAPDNERAWGEHFRVLDQSLAPVRNEAMAPRAGVSRGAVKFRDDFMNALDRRWSQTTQGTGSIGFTGVVESGSGGFAQLTTGNTSGDTTRLDMEGTQPFKIGHGWKLRMVYRPESDSNLSAEWGLHGDANNYVKFTTTAGNVFAESADAGTVESTDMGVNFALGEYICEITHDPYAGEIRFAHANSSASYPDLNLKDQNEATHTTIPSGGAEPWIEITTQEAASKTFSPDFYWIEAERIPSTQ